MRVLAVTIHVTVNSEISAAMRFDGPDFTWSDFYITKWFTLSERMKLRIEGQFFNVFNHPNFALPSTIYAGIPGRPRRNSDSGQLALRLRRQPACWALGLEAIAPRV